MYSKWVEYWVEKLRRVLAIATGNSIGYINWVYYWVEQLGTLLCIATGYIIV
jgi:hypothetical protein